MRRKGWIHDVFRLADVSLAGYFGPFDIGGGIVHQDVEPSGIEPDGLGNGVDTFVGRHIDRKRYRGRHRRLQARPQRRRLVPVPSGDQDQRTFARIASLPLVRCRDSHPSPTQLVPG